MLAALSLTACGAGSGASHSPGSPPSTSSIGREGEGTTTTSEGEGTTTTSGPQALTIVDLQSYGAEDEAIVWSATQQLIATCMSKQGFTYAAIPPEDIAGNRSLASRVDRLDASIASTAGYHAEMISIDPEVQRALDAYNAAGEHNSNAADETPAFVVALEGPEGGEGCLREAYQQMYGDRPPFPELFRELFSPAIESIGRSMEADTRLAGVMSEWSTCMSAAGYEYATTGDPRKQFALEPKVTLQELAVATADSGCRAAVNLVDTQRSVEATYVSEWLDQHPGLVEQLNEAREADVDAAKKVLAN